MKMKRACQGIALLPAAYMIVCLSVFVVYGHDTLPGFDGLRWFMGSVLAAIGVGGAVAIEEEWR